MARCVNPRLQFGEVNLSLMNPEAAIKQAFLDAPTKDKEAFSKLSDGKNQPWQSITNEDYNKTIELIRFVDNLRKKAS